MKYINSIKWSTIIAGLIMLYPTQNVMLAYAQTEANETSAEPNINTEFKPHENMYFNKGCHVCHSNVGQGARSGKPLVSPLLPKEDFFAVVRRPYGIMPAYSPKVLSDRDLAEIYQYLETLESPKVDAIPLLQQLMNEDN